MKSLYFTFTNCLLACIIFFIPPTLHAQTTSPPLPQQTASTSTFNVLNHTQSFDSPVANKALQALKDALSGGKMNVKEMQLGINALTIFQAQAKKCIEIHTAQLDKLDQRLIELSSLSNLPQQKSTALAEEQTYLNDKKQQLNTQLSECRLFSLRAEEVTAQLAQKFRQTVTTHLFYAHPHIIKNLHRLPAQFHQYIQTWDSQNFLKDSGLAFFNKSRILLLLLPPALLFIIAYIRKYLQKKISSITTKTSRKPSLLQLKQQLLIAIGKHYLPMLSSSIILAAFFSIFTHSLITPSYLALISYVSIVYVFFLAIVSFLLAPPAPTQSFIHLPKPLASTLAKQLRGLGTCCFIMYAISICLNNPFINHPLQDVFRTLLITLISAHLIAIIWTIKQLPKPDNQLGIIRLLVSLFLICLLVAVLITEYLGYHRLAIYLLYGTVMTIIVISLAKLLDRMINITLESLKGTTHPWQQAWRRHFGLKHHEQLIEILWLRALLYAVLWVGFLVALLKIWGLAQANFQGVVNGLFHGLDIGKLHIVPSRIVGGTLLFIGLALMTRWVRVYIIKNSRWQLGTGSRESLASIVGYLGFGLAFIWGALVAGVNFSGWALIAGALSVGIGFGLRNLVNNFVSGILLLIEQPIKLGDRILVGQTEGFVKKISILSTHLITTRCSDVIVPNSELIEQQVTNYMLHDMTYKISTTLGIAYGSDTSLVKHTLLHIAQNHPQVILNQPGLEPTVYFRTFGENSLNFELLCVIKDINMKADVVSDLNFAIEKALREIGVKIAQPRREINITQWQQAQLS